MVTGVVFDISETLLDDTQRMGSVGRLDWSCQAHILSGTRCGHRIRT